MKQNCTQRCLLILCIAIFAALTLRPALAENTLTIGFTPSSADRAQMIGDDPLYKRALALFEQAHPDVAVVLREESAGALYADLQSDAPEYDLISAYNFDLEDLRRRNLLVNPLGDETIAAHLERWPNLSLFMYDGALLAVPRQVRFELMCVEDASLLETMGASMPESGWTWQDFYGIGDKVAAYNEANGTAYLHVKEILIGFPFPYCVQQYMDNHIRYSSQPVRFDTPEFRSLLEGWKRMVDLNVVDAERFGSAESASLFSLEILRFDNLDTKTVVPMPVYEPGIRSSIAIADCFIIPVNSPRQALALEFLSYLADPDHMLSEEREYRYAEAGILLAGDETYFQSLADRSQRSLPGQTGNDPLSPSPWPSAEHIALWREQFELATRHTATGFASAVSALVCEYLQGGMPLDDCVARLDAYSEAPACT